MEQTTMNQKSRQERIREARESCNRSLQQRPISSKSEDRELNVSYKKGNLPKKENQIQEPSVKKSTLVRLFIAAVLFLAVFCFDRFQLKAGNIDTGFIQEQLSINMIEEWEEQIAGIINDKVLPVFKNQNQSAETNIN